MAETVLFDRYRLLEPAGRGGSAEVWRALDFRTGDEVAVKRLHPVVFADVAGRARLRREFEALRGLREPHIVRVRDIQVSAREAILVLDYVDGPSLAQILAGQTPEHPAVDPVRAVAIVGDVAAALAAAHGAGIVHRDVTPGNILLAPDGSARLTDFGIAVNADATAVTGQGQLMGTLRYLAPEQLRGEAATPASDLHALAAIAYELLAGRPAYEAASPVALVEAQRAAPAPIAGVPPAMDATVHVGLARDPADRPPDVATFAADLASAGGSEETIPVAIPVTAALAIPAAPAVAEPAIPLIAPPRPTTGPAVPAAAPIAALLAAALTVGLIVAATGNDPGASGGPGAAPSALTVRVAPPTVRPTPSLAPKAKPGKDDHKGKGHGRGHGDEG